MLTEDELGDELRGQLRVLTDQVAPSAELWQRVGAIPDHTRPWRRPVARRFLIPAVVLAATTLIVAVMLGGGSAPTPALAFIVDGGPTVRVSISDIVSIAPANARLAHLGHVRDVPMTVGCRTPTSGFNYAKLKEYPAPRINVADPSTTAPSTTLIVAARHSTDGQIILAIGTVQGSVPSCVSTRGTGPGWPGWTPHRLPYS